MKPEKSKNAYRWDEIGSYVISTIRLPFPEAWSAALGARYETLVYAKTFDMWDVDSLGVQSVDTAAADVAHDAACARIRRRIS